MQKQVTFLRAALVLSLMAGCGEASKDDATDPQDEADSSVPAADPDAGAAQADASVDEPAAENIVETAVAAGSFTVLAKALVDTGLDEALAGEGPFTVFAPTDEAFAALPAGTLDSLSTEQLAAILKYHVIAAQVGSADLTAGPVSTLSGLSAFVSLEGGVKVNGAAVSQADVAASNGVIHVIDAVLLPPNLVQAATYAGGFSSLLGAVESAGLAGALGAADADLTVFAPTDGAFAALKEGTVAGLSKEQLADVLKYHVLPQRVLSRDLVAGPVATLSGKDVTITLEGGVMVNAANVLIADVVTTNGVIHVIDAVLMPE